MSDMNEKELKEWLRRFHRQWVLTNTYPFIPLEEGERAYCTIKQLVKQHYNTPIVNCPRCGSSFKWQDYIDVGAKPQQEKPKEEK